MLASNCQFLFISPKKIQKTKKVPALSRGNVVTTFPRILKKSQQSDRQFSKEGKIYRLTRASPLEVTRYPREDAESPVTRGLERAIPASLLRLQKR